MIIFLVSGYAWVDHIIVPVQQAKYLHTQLDIYLVFFFLVLSFQNNIATFNK
jgi:hypothetical protein